MEWPAHLPLVRGEGVSLGEWVVTRTLDEVQWRSTVCMVLHRLRK